MLSSITRPSSRRIWVLSCRSLGHWKKFELGPPDPIVGLNEAYAADTSPNKVNVGVGAYRTDEGVPHVLPCVREAEQRLIEKLGNHEYLGIAGDPEYVKVALEFVYGKDSDVLKQGRVAGVQTLSGTGGLRVFGELIKEKGGHKFIYLPNPTWGNHIPIFKNSGLEVRKYRYYDPKSSRLEFGNMIADLNEVPEGGCVLLHACAHNPTGMDPTPEQWAEISAVMKKRKLLPFFDCAYQGFASGNAPEDAFAIRMFIEDGHSLATVQSFSKNFGLYGQRVGALSIVTPDEAEAKRVLSQMKMTIRPMYSNPPKYGSDIVKTILSDEVLTNDFINQCQDMAWRINDMRIKLRSALEEGNGVRSWAHITRQIGMFSYSALTQDQVKALRDKHHIYCTLDGRISMAGVTSQNVDYIADSIKDVIKPMVITSPRTLIPYSAPSFATRCFKNIPSKKLELSNVPTPIHRIHRTEGSVLQPLWDLNIDLIVKRDDMTAGVELGGNKVRKLEFLLADAIERGYDTVVTIGGEQSNHCRATAAACRMVGLKPHLILRTKRADSVLKDAKEKGIDSFGQVGNIMYDRMVGATVHMCTPGEYGRFGNKALVKKVAEDLEEKYGSKVYQISVGGSSGLGTWGYIEGVHELKKQTHEQIDHIVFACGSGGTAAGVLFGTGLAYREDSDDLNLTTPKLHAIGVCDSPEYFYNEVCLIGNEMGFDISSSGLPQTSMEDFVLDHLTVHQGKGNGYALSTPEELDFVCRLASETGIVLDPVYSGKALFQFVKIATENPDEYKNSTVMFWHTGGSLGMFDKESEISSFINASSPIIRMNLYGNKSV